MVSKTTFQTLSNVGDQILADGWRRPDAIAATRDFIGPIVGPTLIMLLFPQALFGGYNFYRGLDDPLAACGCICLPYNLAATDPVSVLVRYGYPLVFDIAAVCVLSGHAIENLQKWMQGIRDAEFLVEMRLTNLERNDKDAPPSTTQPSTATTPLDPEPPVLGDPQAPLAPLLPLDVEEEA